MNLKKWRGAAVAWLMMLLPMQAGAQLATASVDPVGDSIAFAKKCLHNIAGAGKFSSDRTIREYWNELWRQ